MYRGIWDKEYRFFHAVRIRTIDDIPSDKIVTIIRMRKDKSTNQVNYSMTTDAIVTAEGGSSIIGKRVIGSGSSLESITVVSDDRELRFVDAKDGVFTSSNKQYEFTTFFIDGHKYDYEIAHNNSIYYVCIRLIINTMAGLQSAVFEVPTYGSSEEEAITVLKSSLDVSMTLGNPVIIRGPY